LDGTTGRCRAKRLGEVLIVAVIAPTSAAVVEITGTGVYASVGHIVVLPMNH